MRNFVLLGGRVVGHACLLNLVRRRGEGINIAGVSGDPRICELARFYNLPVFERLDELGDMGPIDFILSVQYDQILRRRHIEKARELAVNFHMAPLPEYRGCNQFSYAILSQDKEFGTTAHQLTEEIDAGAIIEERRFPIPEGCFVGELYNLCYAETMTLFDSLIPKLVVGDYSLTPQEKYMNRRKCEYHYRDEIERLKCIDLSWEKEKIERHCRATMMPGFPPPYTYVNGRKVNLVPE